jgi:hypothetical protein
MNEAPMSEWLKVVLAEVERKRDEVRTAREERNRRAESAQRPSLPAESPKHRDPA